MYQQTIRTAFSRELMRQKSNTDGYDFGQLKKDLCIKESLMQKIKAIFAMKK